MNTNPMTQVADLVVKAQQATGKPKAIEPTSLKPWIAALFTKFRLRYGRLWTKPYEVGKDQAERKALYEAAKREWGEVLAKCSPEDIDRGLDVWDSEYPPNVYEFRKACRRPPAPLVDRVFKALPGPPRDPEKAKQWRAGLGGVLGDAMAPATKRRPVLTPADRAEMDRVRKTLTPEAEALAIEKINEPERWGDPT